MAHIEIRNLAKRYGETAAVDGVSLDIPDGQLLCLLGPSGCGKTTILRLLAGFLEPDGGEIRVGERLMSSTAGCIPPEQRGMSMIFQSYAVWPHMTVAENVAYGLKLRRLQRPEIRRRVEAILALTRLSTLGDRYPEELSGGQQQRVALARALVVEPQTVLLDEPLSNLDAGLREEMRFEIRRLHEQYRCTTVYVTHDQAEAMVTADRMAVLHGGCVEQIGTPREVFESPESEFVARFLGGTNILKARHVGGDLYEHKDFRLRCPQGRAAPDGDTAISIRLHDIQLTAAQPTDNGTNAAAGRIVRQSYLGAARDYLIALDGQEEIRVNAPASLDMPSGTRVWVRFPPECCRALPR